MKYWKIHSEIFSISSLANISITWLFPICFWAWKFTVFCLGLYNKQNDLLDAADVKSPVQETSKTRQRISSLKKRVSLRGSSGGNKVQSEVLTNKEKREVSLTSDNVGYIDTPPPSRRFSPTTDKYCFHHSKIKVISSRRRVILYIYNKTIWQANLPLLLIN